MEAPGPTERQILDEETLEGHAAALDRERARRERAADDSKSKDDDDDLGLDDDDDDSLLQALRNKRMEEIKLQQKADELERKRNGAGEVKQISADDFADEVTRASQHAPVVMLIFLEGQRDSALMLRCLTTLAARHNGVRFVRLPASSRIQNFPLEDCPTVLAYHKGAKVGQWPTLRVFAGAETNADVVEWELSRRSVLTTKLEADPRGTRANVERFQMNEPSSSSSSGAISTGGSKRARDDDDDDD